MVVFKSTSCKVLKRHGLSLKDVQYRFALEKAFCTKLTDSFIKRQHMLAGKLFMWVSDMFLPFAIVEIFMSEDVITLCGKSLAVLSWITGRKKIQGRKDEIKLYMQNELCEKIPGMVNLATDTWSPKGHSSFLHFSYCSLDLKWLDDLLCAFWLHSLSHPAHSQCKMQNCHRKVWKA